jgi:hypothetical protein
MKLIVEVGFHPDQGIFAGKGACGEPPSQSGRQVRSTIALSTQIIAARHFTALSLGPYAAADVKNRRLVAICRQLVILA